MEPVWLSWGKSRGAEIRERLSAGDEDTVVNLLLFGTSFTHEPRLTGAQLAKLSADSAEASGGEPATQFRALIQSRTRDLVNGMAEPDGNERLLFARRVAERAGHKFSDADVPWTLLCQVVVRVKRPCLRCATADYCLPAACGASELSDRASTSPINRKGMISTQRR